MNRDGPRTWRSRLVRYYEQEIEAVETPPFPDIEGGTPHIERASLRARSITLFEAVGIAAVLVVMVGIGLIASPRENVTAKGAARFFEEHDVGKSISEGLLRAGEAFRLGISYSGPHRAVEKETSGGTQ